MEDIFELFLNFFFAIWENAEAIISPIINIIIGLGSFLIETVTDIIEALINGLGSVWEFIVNVFEFFGVDISNTTSGGGGGGTGR